MEQVQINGVEGFSEAEKFEVNSIVEKAVNKFKRELNNDFLFKVTIKESGVVKDNPKKKKKYSVRTEVSGAMMFESSAEEWDLKKTLHMAIEKLHHEIEHKYHNLDQHRKVVKK